MKRLYGISGGFGVLAAAILALGGCASSTTDSAVPTARGPANTGQFPNLNIPAQVAAPQFTPEQRDASLAGLQAAKQRQSGGPEAGDKPADPQRLKKLAQSHASETLKEIEGQ